MPTTLIVLLVSLTFGPPGTPDPSDEVIVLRHCPVEYGRTTLLASPLSGVLADRPVQPGEAVKAGQVLGRLQDQDVRAEMERHRASATSGISVLVSEAKYARALGKLRTSESLHRRNFMSPEELELDRLDVELARLGVEEAKHERRPAALQARQAEAVARAREFVSPHDGVVVEALKEQGESVAMNEPVFRIVNVDRVRVAGQLDVADAWRVKKGQPVRVSLEVEGADLEVEREVFTGSVIFVDARFESTTQTCRITVEVGNRDHLLRSGLEARVEILPAPALAPEERGPIDPVAGRPRREGSKPGN